MHLLPPQLWQQTASHLDMFCQMGRQASSLKHGAGNCVGSLRSSATGSNTKAATSVSRLVAGQDAGLECIKPPLVEHSQGRISG
jgi:hypothetical protein